MVLLHAPPEHFSKLVAGLADAGLEWRGKSLLFCDCEHAEREFPRFRDAGASVALMRRIGIPGCVAVEGDPPATTFALRAAREMRVRALSLAEGTGTLLDSAVTMGTAAFTPLIDSIARLFRECGARDSESVQLASALFATTAREYAHSGRQSWAWHMRPPDPETLLSQFRALEEPLRSLFVDLLSLGADAFGRHPQLEQLLRIDRIIRVAPNSPGD
jgi:hypothetical protein